MNKNKVVVFSTLTCPWCVRVKQYLKSKDIPFEDVNITFDKAAADKMVKRSGVMSVPQIWVNEQLVVGFDSEKIESYLINE